jgi:two-component system, NarL family, invasion response regulator UvrY
MPSVLIIDDHLLLRQGLKQMLNQEYRGLVFGDAKSSDEARTHLARQPWDLVVLDITIPGDDGFIVLREIRQRHPATPVLVLSMHSDPQYAVRAHAMGASGYICKSAGRADLLKAFSSVLAGRKHFGELPLASPANEASPPHTVLSARERRVILALAAGKRTGEIANELKLSSKTVSTYKRRVLNKLHLRSTADMVRYVIDNRLS